MNHGDDAWIHTLSILLTRYERSLLSSVLGEESDLEISCVESSSHLPRPSQPILFPPSISPMALRPRGKKSDEEKSSDQGKGMPNDVFKLPLNGMQALYR